MPDATPTTPPAAPADRERAAWRLAARVAAILSLLVALGLLAGYRSARLDDPLRSPQLREAKSKLRAAPGDEALKKQIRALDLSLRERYFRQLRRTTSGAWLLAGGVALFVIASRRAGVGRTPAPMPGRAGGAPAASLAAKSRWAVGLTGATVAVVLFGLSLGPTAALPRAGTDAEAGAPGTGAAAAAEPASAGEPDAATPAEMSQNWPRFRGAEGSGVSGFPEAPSTWDGKSGAGITWKTPSPSPGFSSPITWGGKVFFSGGDAAKREVFALDGKTGEVLWRQAITNVPGSPLKPEVPDTTGWAAGTMATDGRRLYAMFANGDVAGLGFDGKVIWSKSFGPLKNPYGHATSLATWQGRLILQLDQGEPEDKKSKLCALDGRNGRVLWEQPRKLGASWASPIVIEAAGKPQIITLSVPYAIAYNAKDGAEIWRVECLNGEVTPSPIFAGGLVVIASPSEKLIGVRPDGLGDVSKTHVAWTNEDNVPDVTSPTGNAELVFGVTTSGVVSCYDAKTGKKLWEHDLEQECHASPSLAAGRLYVPTQKGVTFILEAGREYKEIARSALPDALHASPAFAADRIFWRGVTNIWCVGPKP